MQTRSDVSDKVIHFTSGEPDAAFSKLHSIIAERRLVAGNLIIRGGYRCVCFTEAPLSAVANGFVNRIPWNRYAPFGLMFYKTWIFARGGRPVIYQPACDFEGLPAEIRWRHVRYEPITNPPIDFTWEREWRLPCDELTFSPAEPVIVVPNGEWVSYLLDVHSSEQDMVVEAYETAFEREIAEQLRNPFRWRIVTLG